MKHKITQHLFNLRHYILNQKEYPNMPQSFMHDFLQMDEKQKKLAKDVFVMLNSTDTASLAHSENITTKKGLSDNLFELMLKYTDEKTKNNFFFSDPPLVYDTWKSKDGQAYIGMKRIRSDEPHGIVRRVVKNGDIVEGTYVRGQKHGLCIKMHHSINNPKVTVYMYQNGVDKAHFTFNRKFVELTASGTQRFEADP